MITIPRFRWIDVSVLFNEPKLLKSDGDLKRLNRRVKRFSALQRAEIAEMYAQRCLPSLRICFSALQRAEIAEIVRRAFKLFSRKSFSALQRAEIAEIATLAPLLRPHPVFQCSSTSRNC